jgi:hypothetical protein
MVTRMDFREALNSAKAELTALQQELGTCLKQQEVLEKKIVAVRQMIVGFSDALGEQFVEEDSLGLTDAIRQAFKTSSQPMTPTDVKGRLELLGYDTSKYGNLMASVHTIITRLTRQGQITAAGTAGNKPTYRWVQKMDPLPAYPPTVSPPPTADHVEDALKKTFEPQLGYPDPLNQRGKK